MTSDVSRLPTGRDILGTAASRPMIKKRNPALGYVGILLLQIFFLIYWAYSLFSESRALSASRSGLPSIFFWLLFSASIAVLSCFCVALLTDLGTPRGYLFFLAEGFVVFWFFSLVGFVFVTNVQINHLLGRHTTFVDSALISILTLLFFVSFPVMQAKLNRAIEAHHQPR